jgi:hypothetical protein
VECSPAPAGRRRSVAVGLVTDAKIDQHLANVAAGRVPDLATAPVVSAWDTRAEGPVGFQNSATVA